MLHGRKDISESERMATARTLKRIKILQVIARLNIGGPARQIAFLATELNADRFAMVVVTGQPSPEEGDMASLLPKHVRHLVIPELGRSIYPVRDVIAFWKLFGIIQQEQPHLIHTHTAKAGALGRLAGLCYNVLQRLHGQRHRVALVHTFHGHVFSGYFNRFLTGMFTGIERWLARYTDALVAISPSLRDELLRLGIGDRSRLRVVPFGFNLSAFSGINGYQDTLRKHLTIPPSVQLVGIVGRLVPIKQHDLFLEAARQVCDRDPLVQFVIVGDGELRAPLEILTRRLKLSDRVHFVGWETNLPGVYADLDCVCLTSRNEGTPASILEAMAAGRPVVATAVGGVVDLLGEVVERQASYGVAQRGVLVQLSDSVGGFTSAIERVLHDAELRGRLTEAGRAFVRERFTAPRLVAGFTTLYEDLLVRSSGCRS